MAITLRELIGELTSCHLLDQEQCSLCLEQYGMDIDSGDAAAFSGRLVAEARLTPFQASAAMQKRSSALVIGDYHVLDVIGSGGMGQVYKARHRIMKRLVAIKIMHTSRATNQKLVQRFYREVEAVSRLSHPNIVTAHDAGETPGGLYLAMEYVDGVDLSVILQKTGALSVNQAINITLQVARGLAYAHGHKVVHRDIKPSNLLLARDGTVKILDMGLARFTEDEAAEVSLTMVGPLMGTVEYMAPEHAANARHADHRSDIYSLGCTMYRLLTGHLPYGGETAVEKVIAQREHPIPQLNERIADIPESLQGIFARMVAKTPEDRYQSMDDCLGDLVKIAGQAEHCDISGLTNINLATATTIYDEGPPDAETTISESVHPPVTLDVATGLEEAETDIEPDEPAPKKRRRGARLLLAEIAIVIGVAVGIGLRTYFTDETPVRKPVDGAWRALLDTIDIEQDTISENWKSLPRDGIVAFANETQNSRIAVGETLAPNYQVRMVFTRYEGPCGVGLVLPLGSGKQVSLEMDASNGSKTVLGDENYGVLTEYDGPLLTTGVRQMCLVTVENKLDWTRIRITLDGRKLIDYNGPTADLHCDPKWASKPGRLGVGVHKLVSAQIHELSVRSFTGDLAESRPATLP